MKLILASASERRKQLLKWLGLEFEVRESGFDESGVEADNPELLVGALALAKAQTVADQVRGELWPSMQLEKEVAPKRVEEVYVLGADTEVYFEGETMGKPRDIDHAREMLSRLCGMTHEAYSGVALVDVLSGKHKVVTEKSVVVFREFSEEELADYLASGEPMGKAGAYMILGKARDLVADLSGSVTNVTGLPLARTVGLLSDFKIPVKVDVEKAVMKKTGFVD